MLLKICKDPYSKGLSEKEICKYIDDINTADKWCRRPIYYAIINQNITIIGALVNSGKLDLSLTSKIHNSNNYELPFSTALRSKNSKIIDILAIHVTNNNCFEYLTTALKTNIEIFKLFLSCFNIVSLKGSEMMLCSYAKIPHYYICYQNNICFDLQEALKYTLIYRKYSSFEFLLKKVKYSEQLNYEYNSNINSYGCRKFTLLSIASIQGYLKGATLLLTRGANIYGNIISSKHENLNYLMYICSNKSYYSETPSTQQQIIDTIKLLITKGIPVNYQNNIGQTALMISARSNNLDFIKILLEHNADKTLKDMNNRIAHDYIDVECGFGQFENNSKQIIQLLGEP